MQRYDYYHLKVEIGECVVLCHPVLCGLVLCGDRRDFGNIEDWK